MTRLATVIGGSGFIGRHVVRRLARAGWLVRVGVRRPDEALFLKPMGDLGQITPVAANIRDERSIAEAVAGASVVVNLVGVLYERGRQGFAAVHVEGAGRVARLAKAAGVDRFVHVSAIGANPASPSAYARTKAAGEKAVLEAFPTATILRPSIVFGPEDEFFNRFARLSVLLPALPLIGGGRTRFQPVYVGDVAEAAMKAIEDPTCRGKVYELGSPRVFTFKELLELLLREIGRRRLLLPVPFALAELQGAILSCLPRPPLTRDQVRLLRQDNVVAPAALTLADLAIAPSAVEAILPTYMEQYRRGGRYASRPGQYPSP
jgi:NADH dehydrogenase